MSGILYGVGVGPGDPELMTRKACRILGAVRVVAYPETRPGQSMARTIAADALTPEVEEIPIPLPMRRDRDPAQAAYDRASGQIAAHLGAGRDVAVLCEGDPMFYGSFMYLAARLGGEHRIEIVPGITSVSAVAAAARVPLVARSGRMSVIPAPVSDLDAAIAGAETVVVMKLGRHIGPLRSALAERGLLDTALYVEHATRPEERVCPLADAPDDAPYFSMALIRRESDPWLS